jgi:hypothetical protein
VAIEGIEGMTPEQISFEVQRGGKFVVYSYCISLIVITLRRGTPVYFVRADENRVATGMKWTLITLLLGWWGIPFGPIFSVISLVQNLRGGKDVTSAIVVPVRGAAPPPIGT